MTNPRAHPSRTRAERQRIDQDTAPGVSPPSPGRASGAADVAVLEAVRRPRWRFPVRVCPESIRSSQDKASVLFTTPFRGDPASSGAG
jgi:hypothetical protein